MKRPLRAAAVTVVVLAAGALAQRVAELKPSDYVNDYAHVLSPETTAQLDSICQQVDQQAHAQIAVVPINSLEGSDIESYAADLFKRWGIGYKSTDRGVLILVAVRDHRYRIEVGYGLEPILPDGKVGGFGREAIPYLRSNDYNNALLLLTTRIAYVIADDAKVEIDKEHGVPAPHTEYQPETGLSTGALILIVIIVLIVIFMPLRSLLFWWLLSGGGWGRPPRRWLLRRWLGWRIRQRWRIRRLWRRQFGRRWCKWELVNERAFKNP